MRRFRNRRKEQVEGDVDLRPLMSVFIAVIPMLLLSAVFLEMAVIKMNLPSGDAGAAEEYVPKEQLGLTVYILANDFAVEARDLPRQIVSRASADASESLAAILRAVAAAHPENKDVIIGSGPDVLYQDIIGVMDVSRSAGIANVSLLGIGTI